MRNADCAMRGDQAAASAATVRQTVSASAQRAIQRIGLRRRSMEMRGMLSSSNGAHLNFSAPASDVCPA